MARRPAATTKQRRQITLDILWSAGPQAKSLQFHAYRVREVSVRDWRASWLD